MEFSKTVRTHLLREIPSLRPAKHPLSAYIKVNRTCCCGRAVREIEVLLWELNLH